MGTRILALCFSLLAIPATGFANNTTAAGAHSIVPGGTASEAQLHPITPERWYVFSAVAGRSYCAETQGGVMFDDGPTLLIDTTIDVFRADTTTSIGSNNDMSTEPRGNLLSRVCWIPANSELTYVKIRAGAPTDEFSVRVRVVETTLFSNWFYLGQDYSAFTMLRNTTNSSVSYTINWRSSLGNVVATISGTLPANGSTFYDARSFAGALAATSGTIDIAFTGSPQAIVASTTVLSTGTGLSFDAPFSQRTPW